MLSLTTGLFIFAIVLILVNVMIDLYQGDFMGLGYLGYSKSGFTPMSYSFESWSPVFHPEGYGKLGRYQDFKIFPYMKRSVDVGGIPRSELLEKYTESDYDPYLFT